MIVEYDSASQLYVARVKRFNIVGIANNRVMSIIQCLQQLGFK